MARYIIFFNQQWVGDHPAEWYDGRGPLARAVVEDMRQAGVLVFAGGLVEEFDDVFHVDPTGGSLEPRQGRYSDSGEWLGGLTIVDVASDEEARLWGSRIAEACGWPQEVRPIKS